MMWMFGQAPKCGLVNLNLDKIRCMKLTSWKEYFKVRSCSSFLIEEIDLMDETLGSLWKEMTILGRHSFSNGEMDDVNGW